MKKKWMKFVAAACAVFGVGAAVACSGDGGLTDLPYSMNVQETEFDLLVGNSAVLTVDYDYQPTASLRFESDNTDVVTVNEFGEVTGVSAGVATVTAFYGDATDTVTVNVSFGEFVPQFYLYQAEETSFTVAKGKTLNLQGYVLFNGKTYTDGQFTYTPSESGYGEVSQGVFTAGNKVGSFEMEIACEWRGLKGAMLTETYEIEVIHNVLMQFENCSATDEVELYSAERVGTQTFQNTFALDVTCEIDGAAVSDDDLEYVVTDGTDYIAFDSVSKTVTGKKSGQATLQVSYSADGKVYTKTLSVNVLLPVIDYAPTIVFDAYLGELPLQEIFGDSVSLISAKGIDGETLSVSENKICGVSVNVENPTERNLTVYAETLGANLTIKAYSRVIKTAEDLRFFQYSENTGDAFDGYYILANHIDATNYVHDYQGALGGVSAATNVKQNTGLTGTFDGQGYTIDGITFGYHNGLFGMIGGNAVLKNVAITNVQFVDTTSYQGMVLAFGVSLNSSPKLENVYIQTTKMASNDSGIFNVINTGRLTMNNCIFEISRTVGTKRYGSLSVNYHATFTPEIFAAMKFSNVYVLSSVATTYYDNNAKQHYVDGMNITTPTDDGKTWNKWNGLYRYETAEDMANGYEGALTYDATNGYAYTQSDNKHDFKSFTDSGFWTVTTGGIPVWKKLTANA